MKGRPRKFTVEGELDIVARLFAGQSVGGLAKQLGVSRQTILRIRKRQVRQAMISEPIVISPADKG